MALPLMEVLNSGNDLAREFSAALLGAIGDSRSVPALIKALQDKEWAVRYVAIEALGKIGDTDAIEPIKLCVIKAKSEEERVRGQGIIVLDEVFNISGSELREVLLKSNVSEEAKRRLKQKGTVKRNKAVEGVTFVKKKRRAGNTYEVYSAKNKELAWEFIRTKSVDKPYYYIEVNVGDVNNPDIIVGVDIQGTYEI